MSTERITVLINEWQSGNERALDEAMPLLHAELKRLASHYMQNERAGHTLQSTALVNEAWMRLIDVDLEIENRGHLLALAARIMRRILVDHARQNKRKKRNDGEKPLPLDESAVLAPEGDPRILYLDDALNRLAEFDARLSKTVELIYFGGLTTQQAADALGVSRVTLNKDLNLAKAWLHQQLGEDQS